MAKKSTAKKIKDLNNYVGEVGLFELSKGIKRGALLYKNVVVARFKPRSGVNNTSVWLSDEYGKIVFLDPIKEMVSSDITNALDLLGYKLV